MVVSLKANKKRILAFVLLAAVVVGAWIFLKGRDTQETEKQTFPGGSNEERVSFLKSFGWEIDTDPAETREVMIPAEFNDVYTTYNVMQKAQGFDLKPYAGQVCTQYKYKVNNYPGETEVYATLLVYGEMIIGGDLACAEVDGFMHGFASDSARYGETENRGSVSQKSGDASSQLMESSASSGIVSEMGEETSAPGESAVESTAGEALSEEAFPTD